MSGWLSFVLFQVVWFAAVLGAAREQPLWGPLSALLLIALAVRTSRDPRSELVRVAAACGVGLALDGALGASGWVNYSAHPGPSWLAPGWILALWAGFATTLEPALSWLSTRLPVAALLGGALGPAAYYSGSRLGALETSSGLAFAVLALGWATATPLLLLLSRKLRERSLVTDAPRVWGRPSRALASARICP